MFKLIMTFLLWAAVPTHAKLQVIVENVQPGKGVVVVELYDNSERFRRKRSLVSQTLKAAGTYLQFTFEVPEGQYALKVFQDINENGICDEGWFHIPKEPYGLGNNFRPRYSAPTFDDCKFAVTNTTTQRVFLLN